MFDLKGLSYEQRLLLKDKFDSLSTDEEVGVLTSELSDRISLLEGREVTIEQVNDAVQQAVSSVQSYDDSELRGKITELESRPSITVQDVEQSITSKLEEGNYVNSNDLEEKLQSIHPYDDSELKQKVTVLEGQVGTSSIEGQTLTNAFSVLRSALSTYRNSNKDLDAIKNLLGELESLV